MAWGSGATFGAQIGMLIGTINLILLGQLALIALFHGEAACAESLQGDDAVVVAVFAKQVQHACAKPGMSETDTQLAGRIMVLLDKKLGSIRTEVDIASRDLEDPTIFKKRKLEEASQQLRLAQQRVKEIQFFHNQYPGNSDSDLAREREAARVASGRLRELQLQSFPAIDELQSRTARIDSLLRFSHVLEALRNDARFCYERAQGFPGKAFSPYVDRMGDAPPPAANTPADRVNITQTLSGFAR